MSNPRFRNVGKDVDPKAPSYINRLTNKDHQYPGFFGNGTWGEFFGDMLLQPYNRKETRLGVLDSVHILLTTLLGSFVFGWLVYIVLWAGLNSAPATPNFIIYVVTAIVAGAVLFVTFHWTFEKDLPTYILPEIAMVMIATRKIGLLPALLIVAIQFFGYFLAGIFLHIINGAYFTNDAFVNNSVMTNGVGFGLYFFAGFVYTFNYIYSREFDILSEPDTSDKSMHMRAAVSTSVIFGVLVLTCLPDPMRLTAISAGPYLTTAVFHGNGFNLGSVYGVVPWAFYIFVGMLAVPAAAALVYHIVCFIKSYTRGWKAAGEDWNFRQEVAGAVSEGDYEKVKGPISIPYASTNLKERLAGVKLNVEY